MRTDINKRIAVFGFNSLYRCGTSAFMMHLTDRSEWPLIIFNDAGVPLSDDLPLPENASIDLSYKKYEDFGNIVSKFDYVIIAAPKWHGEYDFIDVPSKCQTEFSVVVHDLNDFERMNSDLIIKKVSPKNLFYFDSYTGAKIGKYIDTRNMILSKLYLPYSRCMMHVSEKCSFDVYVVCSSRDTPSKKHLYLKECLRDFDVRFLSNGNNGYSWRDAAEIISNAACSVDLWELSDKYDSPSYTALDAWNYRTPFLCLDKNICGEMISGVNCLVFSRENVELVSEDLYVRMNIINNAETFLNLHDSARVRSLITELSA